MNNQNGQKFTAPGSITQWNKMQVSISHYIKIQLNNYIYVYISL